MSGFKRCSYIVFFLCLALASLIGPGSSIHFSWICFKWHVHVVNQLSSGRSLFVHFKSKDDDLGQRDLAIGSWYSWKFRENCIGQTLYWCYVRTEPGDTQLHSQFDSFWSEKRHTWLKDRCTNYNGDSSKNCIWTAKDDGIYIRNVTGNYDEIAHKWEPGW